MDVRFIAYDKNLDNNTLCAWASSRTVQVVVVNPGRFLYGAGWAASRILKGWLVAL